MRPHLKTLFGFVLQGKRGCPDKRQPYQSRAPSKVAQRIKARRVFWISSCNNWGLPVHWKINITAVRKK